VARNPPPIILIFALAVDFYAVMRIVTGGREKIKPFARSGGVVNAKGKGLVQSDRLGKGDDEVVGGFLLKLATPGGLSGTGKEGDGADVEFTGVKPDRLHIFAEGAKRMRGAPRDGLLLGKNLKTKIQVLDIYRAVRGVLWLHIGGREGPSLAVVTGDSEKFLQREHDSSSFADIEGVSTPHYGRSGEE